MFKNEFANKFTSVYDMPILLVFVSKQFLRDSLCFHFIALNFPFSFCIYFEVQIYFISNIFLSTVFSKLYSLYGNQRQLLKFLFVIWNTSSLMAINTIQSVPLQTIVKMLQSRHNYYSVILLLCEVVCLVKSYIEEGKQ